MRKDEMRLNEKRQNIQTRRQRRLDEKKKTDDTRWEKTAWNVTRRQRKGNSMRWEETRRHDRTRYESWDKKIHDEIKGKEKWKGSRVWRRGQGRWANDPNTHNSKSLALHKVACSKTEAPQIKDNTILPSHYKHKARWGQPPGPWVAHTA